MILIPKKIKNDQERSHGIALLLVLATLALLSGIVVEFAYNSNVTYQLAINEKEQLQSYYLAQSAIGFGKMMIFYDSEAKKLVQNAGEKAGKNVQIKPLYELVPIDTALLRGLTSPESAPSEGEGGAKSEEENSEQNEGKNQVQSLVGGLGIGGGSSFLQFEGDFSTEVIPEEAKLNVNAFAAITPTQRSYQRLKSTLYHLLLTKDFEGMFTDRFQGAQELAQNIADFIDKDDSRNGPQGEEQGREAISGGKNISMKNAKLLTLEELLLVPGMTDSIFQKLKENVTIYGSDEKIIICQAKDPLIKAMIVAYTENNSKVEPIRDDNKELLDKGLEAVINSCPDLQAMASEVDKVLGIAEGSASPTPPPTRGILRGATTQGQGTAGPVSDQFSSQAKTEGKLFSIIGTGTVGEIKVKLSSVVDTSNSNPNNWNTIYWREE